MSSTDGVRADLRVRTATIADAPAIAQVQAAAWQRGYATLLPPEALDEFDADAATEAWTAALVSPPSSQHHVLVALAGDTVVGFAAWGPGADGDADPTSDAEILALHVAPRHSRDGHGSRLMTAVVDHARTAGKTRLLMWVFAADDPLRQFLRDNGWAPDGSTRDLDAGELMHQVRLHTAISERPDIIA